MRMLVPSKQERNSKGSQRNVAVAKLDRPSRDVHFISGLSAQGSLWTTLRLLTGQVADKPHDTMRIRWVLSMPGRFWHLGLNDEQGAKRRND